MEFMKLKSISLKNHPNVNEKWVQQIIANDPTILGIGDIELKDMERKQPRAGRLDLLFQEEDKFRYCVELQLGKTDESHIIRTIEYWDLERKRYPHFDHTAVIIAEDITSRFLNVISLFNNQIPIIAIQMSGIEVGDKLGLHFTKVLDETALQPYPEDDGPQIIVDRSYWEEKATKETMKLADNLLDIIHEKIDKTINFKYTKSYIGLERKGLVNNFVVFKPKKHYIKIEPKLEENEKYDNIIEDSGLDALDYNQRGRYYRIRLSKEDIEKHKDLITVLLVDANQYFNF